MRASSGADAVLTSTPTALTQSSTTASSFLRELRLVDVVLVLADADRLRIDPHELGERILQPPRDRDRAAQRHVEVGKLLRRELRRRIDRRAGLATRRPWSAAAPACRAIRSPASLSVSRDAVPLPIEIELHAVLRAQLRRACAARPPSPCAARADRSVAVSSSLPVPSTTATLTPVRMPGIEAHRRCAGRPARRAAGRAGCGRTRGSLRPPPARAAAARSRSRGCGEQLDLPGPAHRLGQPRDRPARPLSLDAGARGDAPLRLGRAGRAVGVRQHDGETEDAFVAAAQQRQRRGATARCFTGSLALK